MQIIDELHKLERDLTGLMNLLYCVCRTRPIKARK